MSIMEIAENHAHQFDMAPDQDISFSVKPALESDAIRSILHGNPSIRFTVNNSRAKAKLFMINARRPERLGSIEAAYIPRVSASIITQGSFPGDVRVHTSEQYDSMTSEPQQEQEIEEEFSKSTYAYFFIGCILILTGFCAMAIGYFFYPKEWIVLFVCIDMAVASFVFKKFVLSAGNDKIAKTNQKNY